MKLWNLLFATAAATQSVEWGPKGPLKSMDSVEWGPKAIRSDSIEWGPMGPPIPSDSIEWGPMGPPIPSDSIEWGPMGPPIPSDSIEWGPKSAESLEWSPKHVIGKGGFGKAIPALACGATATLGVGQEVTIESPGFPDNYPASTTCAWSLAVPAGEVVTMWCETFAIRRGDSIEIVGVYDRFYGTFNDGIGSEIAASSVARNLEIIFRSNRRRSKQGFRCQFSSADDSSSGSGSTSTGCTTVDGAVSGAACVFPFIYGGETIGSCTTIDGDSRAWCSTQTNANGNHVQGNWGYCDASCAGGQATTAPTAPPATTALVTTAGSDCNTVSGDACVFPFTYNGFTATSCTTEDGDPQPWCSTQTNANGVHVQGNWGYCEASCPGGAAIATTAATVAPATTVPGLTPLPGTCQCGVKGGANGRIVGGKPADANEYPWQVGLVGATGRTPYCGGTLISSTHVLTAAHCTAGSSASQVYVLLGEHATNDNIFTRVPVAQIIDDPNYNSQTTNSDFSILRLAQPVPFTSTVSPACLPADLTKTYAGSLATVTGWGTLSSGGNQPSVLHEVDLTITTNQSCNNAYGSITNLMVCAADTGKDSCQGDSGGPLVVQENGRHALVGVVSWGAGCADAKYPGVYARVTARMDWIVANTQGTFSSICQALN